MRTEFTMAEVGKLATVFAKYAGVANHISKETFLKVMKNHMPGLVTNDEQLVEKIFRLADPVRPPQPPPPAPRCQLCQSYHRARQANAAAASRSCGCACLPPGR